ncbi:MAG: GC-type dockerin domain-anchored protein, partial [Phycisphaerales bacterium]
GWSTYRASTCNDCHVAPIFTNNAFGVNGVRPVFEDRGRADFSGTEFERGAFRMGSLRNLGNRDRFMHTGGLETIDDVFDFYAHRNGQEPFPENLDFRIRNPIEFSPEDEEIIKHFITTALTDPRVTNEEFPFDRPKLYSESDEPNPAVIEQGTAGTEGFTPAMIAVTPPNIGNLGFKIGVDFALGGAQAWVAISQSPPTGGKVAQDELIGPIELNGMSAGEGYGTLIYPIDEDALDGQTIYMQWVIADPAAADGFARSPIARVTPFCSVIGACEPQCVADINGDGSVNFNDISFFLNAFGKQEPAADIDGNGVVDYFDISGFINAYAAGCP